MILLIIQATFKPTRLIYFLSLFFFFEPVKSIGSHQDNSHMILFKTWVRYGAELLVFKFDSLDWF
jgi:hypothetical protein